MEIYILTITYLDENVDEDNQEIHAFSTKSKAVECVLDIEREHESEDCAMPDSDKIENVRECLEERNLWEDDENYVTYRIHKIEMDK